MALIGLCYVGLPLAVEFGKKYDVIGFDINEKRIDQLKKGNDRTLEVSSEELAEAVKLSYTTKLEDLKRADVFIVTVPTPVDDFKVPDLTPIIKASETVGKVIKNVKWLFMNQQSTLAARKKIVSLYLKSSAD